MRHSDEKRAADRAKYAANPEYYRNKSREYGQRNKEARAAYTAAYRAANPEKVKASKARRYTEHPERNAAYAKAYRQRNPEQHKASYRRQNLKKYGLTPHGVGVLRGQQEGRCAICTVVFGTGYQRMHIDHCHSTGKVRGLLCQRCNLLIGHAKDDLAVLLAAVEYLKRPAPRPT